MLWKIEKTTLNWVFYENWMRIHPAARFSTECFLSGRYTAPVNRARIWKEKKKLLCKHNNIGYDLLKIFLKTTRRCSKTSYKYW